jgi:hypothetical protein
MGAGIWNMVDEYLDSKSKNPFRIYVYMFGVIRISGKFLVSELEGAG